MANEYIQIGMIVASFGIKGELILRHEMGHSLASAHISSIFIEQNKNNFIPYFVTAIKNKNEKEAYFKIEDIDSRETAHTFLKKKVYLKQDQFLSIVSEESNLYYIGFTIIDKKEGELGIIQEIIQLPEQLIAKVKEDKNELLIPLTDQTITNINKEKRQITVLLPEGLTDIYR